MSSFQQGIHKLTYDIDNEEFTLNLKLDSPWIENGHATAFLTFNVEKNLYGIRIALSDQHFMRYGYILWKAKISYKRQPVFFSA